MNSATSSTVMPLTTSSRLGQMLVEKSVINTEQLKRAIEIQSREPVKGRRRLGEILVTELGAHRDKVYSTIAQLYAFPIIDIEVAPLTIEQLSAIKSFYESLNEKNRDQLLDRKLILIPASATGGAALLLSPDPTERDLPDLISAIGVKRFEIAYTRLDSLQQLIAQIYPVKNEFLQILEDVNAKLEVISEESAVDEEALDAEINQSMLVNLVEGALVEAVRQGASDIHIIPQSGNVSDFYFRLDGKLKLWYRQEGIKPEAIAAVFKDRTKNVDRFERDMAQDGFVQRKIDDHMMRFRVSIIPIVGQEFERKLESIVLRVIDDRKVITDLEKLGLQPQARADYIKAISAPQGMVILTGPTGSGKSTTLMGALYHVITPEKCILTVEEPVEYLIKGARQIKISDKLDFDMAIRAILRHDPDIVMVGEMRDKKTAEIGIKLANTGHLTFSTLHTNDAPSSVARLFKMGIEPFLIAYAINIIVAQRLVRTLCKVCKEPVNPNEIDEKVLLASGFSDDEIRSTTFFKPVGCPKCNAGWKGRAAIHEALYFHKDLRELIISSKEDINEQAIRELAISHKMLTLRKSGFDRVKSGVTTIDEILGATTDE
ncbi:MAG: GspE/PulE family protein [bacterium]|nr:GspE/PulE family protein [bacterium]